MTIYSIICYFSGTTALAEIAWTDKWMVFLTAGLVFLAAFSLAVTFYIAVKANRWAHKYWRKQKEEELNYQLDALRYKSRLEAAKAAWGLLAFLSEKENEKSFLAYRGSREKPEVYFNLDRGRDYLNALSEIFYDQGHGIFLTKEINQEIFHVRTNVYAILNKERHRGVDSGEVLLENEGMVIFFRDSFENLRVKVKKYCKEELRHEVEE